jgi:hypothetical protein
VAEVVGELAPIRQEEMQLELPEEPEVMNSEAMVQMALLMMELG